MSEKIRRFFFWTHLCLGLGAGIMFLVMCFTGILLAYRPQLEMMMNHWGLSSKPPVADARPLPIEELLQRVRVSEGATPQAITIYPEDSRTVDIYLGRAAGTVYVDTYSGASLGRPSPGVFRIFARLMSWHTAMGISGNTRLGSGLIDVGNLVAFISIVVGIYLWVPRKWTWRHIKAVLLFRPGLAGKAREFNWHNVIGIWVLVPLAVMVWSGVAMSYHWADQATVKVVALMQPERDNRPPLQVIGSTSGFGERDPFDARVAGMNLLVKNARAKVPAWKSISFEVPESMASPVIFSIDPTGFGLIKGGTASRLELDRSGEELAFQTPAQIRGRGVYRFAHTGELWGQWGQTIGMLGCLGGVFLLYTGVALSVRRMGSWRARRARTRFGKDSVRESGEMVATAPVR